MIEDLGEQQNTGICVTRTRNSAGQNHYTTSRRPLALRYSFASFGLVDKSQNVYTYLPGPSTTAIEEMIRQELNG